MVNLGTLGRLKGVSPGSGGAAGVVSPPFGGQGGTFVVIKVQGLNTLTVHWQAVQAATLDLTRQAVETSGKLTTKIAREMHRPHIRTGETFRSIRMDGQTPADGNWGNGMPLVDFDGDTFSIGVIAEGGRDPSGPSAAQLLEFGFYHVGAGRFVGPYPFMFPALDLMTSPFVRVMRDIALIAQRGAFSSFSGQVGNEVAPRLQPYRKWLYSTAKALGDIQVFMPSPWIGGLRSTMYRTARGLGDVQSAMMGTIGQRLTERITGRFSGRGIAASRSSVLSGSFGPGYQRVYNRVIGREVGKLGLRRFG